MKTLTFLSAAALLTAAAHAAVIIETFSLSTTTIIPDDDLNGLVQIPNPTTTIGLLDSITVSLTTTGGWNGDLYAYLWHGGEISLLIIVCTSPISPVATKPPWSTGASPSLVMPSPSPADVARFPRCSEPAAAPEALILKKNNVSNSIPIHLKSVTLGT